MPNQEYAVGTPPPPGTRRSSTVSPACSSRLIPISTGMVIASRLDLSPSSMAQSVNVPATNGAPISGATVTVTDTRTGATRTITTGGNGVFTAENLVTGGPYRFLSHPNYVAVVIEGFALPLVHSAWITAVVFTLCNAALLTVRIRVENRALTALPRSAAAPAGPASAEVNP